MGRNNFVVINDFSRELYVAILPDKIQYSAANFFKINFWKPLHYWIETWYTDNSTGYKGDPEKQAFAKHRTKELIT